MALSREREKAIRKFLAAPPFGRRNVPADHIEMFSAALTHDSYANEEASRSSGTRSYERLEFLGDAVLELAVCEFIYSDTELNEGAMTDLKKDIVCNKNISLRVTEAGIDIDDSLLVGEGHKEKRTGSNVIEENMRADAFEAVLGAVYLLYGIEEAERIVREVLIAPIKENHDALCGRQI
ncbi:MAG: ribonuclease III domain-containing protein [Methanomassiliicoccaceae archaeon]|nr:ribonuclease III domain-containing protein [Methanomassiliicoccaceae archaeon]